MRNALLATRVHVRLDGTGEEFGAEVGSHHSTSNSDGSSRYQRGRGSSGLASTSTSTASSLPSIAGRSAITCPWACHAGMRMNSPTNVVFVIMKTMINLSVLVVKPYFDLFFD